MKNLYARLTADIPFCSFSQLAEGLLFLHFFEAVHLVPDSYKDFIDSSCSFAVGRGGQK
jgi:hypothetical protein